MKKMLALTVLGLAFAGQSFAQDFQNQDFQLVKKRTAEDPFQHRFLDRHNTIAIASTIAVRSADAALTCQGLRQGFREGGLPTQTCSGAIGWSAGFTGLSVAGAWLLHKMHHHNMERAASWAAAPGSAIGVMRWSRLLSK